ncbi:hypothetical protein ACFV4P_03140 [Kitasatospora sp. NPDC059795]|uniref:hypothetical protein n=1 Tax=Kitasatospora sp. NPDC059795 TaxID=3346949 RepID=UPI0036662F82
MVANPAPNTHIALDAATPIAEAMAALPIGSRGAVRIGYLGESVIAHYGPLAADEVYAAMTIVTTAFARAGWGFHNRYRGEGETLHRTRFTHPLNLTRIGRPGTGPHTLSSTLDRALDLLGRPEAVERLAPHMAPEEVESVALLLATAGRSRAGIAWSVADRTEAHERRGWVKDRVVEERKRDAGGGVESPMC